MSKRFVVMKTGYEYNDEYYTQHDEGQGKPHKVYKNKKKAIADAKVLNAKEFDGLDVSSYGYDLEDVSNLAEEDFMEEWKQITGHECPFDFEGGGGEIPLGLPQDQLEKIAELFSLKFYYIEEVDSDE